MASSKSQNQPKVSAAPASVTGGGESSAGGNVGSSGNGTVKDRKPAGPALLWNTPRRSVLVMLVASGEVTTMRDLIAALKTDPAFSGVPAEAFSGVKVARELKRLREGDEDAGIPGLDLPQLTGSGRSVPIDYAALRKIAEQARA